MLAQAVLLLPKFINRFCWVLAFHSDTVDTIPPSNKYVITPSLQGVSISAFAKEIVSPCTWMLKRIQARGVGSTQIHQISSTNSSCTSSLDHSSFCSNEADLFDIVTSSTVNFQNVLSLIMKINIY